MEQQVASLCQDRDLPLVLEGFRESLAAQTECKVFFVDVQKFTHMIYLQLAFLFSRH
jgi:hypothetical protein